MLGKLENKKVNRESIYDLPFIFLNILWYMITWLFGLIWCRIAGHNYKYTDTKKSCVMFGLIK